MVAITTEATLFYFFIALLIVVIATLILILIHSGFFTEINIQTCKPHIGEVKIAYKFAQGPYKESGALFTEVHSLLPQYRTIGVYYDDPKKREAYRLRYAVGVILSENGQEINKEEEKILSEQGYKFASFPAVNYCVQTSFPFKNTISIVVAIFRVYPLLAEYVESRSLCAHPFMEVYDNDLHKIFYIAPLENQDGFYVPEAIQAEEENNTQNEFGEESESQSNESTDESLGQADENATLEDEALNKSIPVSEPLFSPKNPATGSVPPDAGTKKGGEGAESDHTSSSFEEIDESDAPPSGEK